MTVTVIDWNLALRGVYTSTGLTYCGNAGDTVLPSTASGTKHRSRQQFSAPQDHLSLYNIRQDSFRCTN